MEAGDDEGPACIEICEDPGRRSGDSVRKELGWVVDSGLSSMGLAAKVPVHIICRDSRDNTCLTLMLCSSQLNTEVRLSRSQNKNKGLLMIVATDLNGTSFEQWDFPPSALEFSRLVHISRPVLIKGRSSAVKYEHSTIILCYRL